MTISTVLIIDDHPAICFALKVSLENKESLRVITSSGDRMLSNIRELKPDLVVLEIELHNHDGLLALPRIKHAFPHTRVLVLTGQPASLYALRAQQAGADGFANKHLPLATINSLCHLILEGYQCFPDTVLHTLHSSKKKEDARTVLSHLSDRELTVLRLLHAGNSNKAIAEMLALSSKTISTYKARMLKKSGLDSIESLFTLLSHEEESP